MDGGFPDYRGGSGRGEKVIRQLVAGLIGALILFLLAARGWGINNPPFDHESWRQADTESMALRISTTEPGLHWLLPQLYYEGAAPNFVQLEPPLFPLVTGLIYRVIGRQFWVPRLLSVLLFALSAVFLYRLGRRYFRPLTALMGTLFYVSYPISLYYSRAIMPEPLLLFFYLAAALTFDRWAETQRPRDLWLTVLALNGSLLTKPQSAILGLPLLALLLSRQGWASFRRSATWALGLLALAPPVGYFFWLGRSGLVEAPFVSGILQHHVIGRGGLVLFQAETWQAILRLVKMAFTPIGAGAAAASLLALFLTLAARPTERGERLGLQMLLWWGLGGLLYILVVISVIKFDYYLLLLAPPAALASAWLFQRLAGTGSAFRLVVVVLCTLGALYGVGRAAVRTVSPWLQVTESMYGQVQAIQKVTAPGDLILVGSYSPELLAGSGRYGWRLHIHTQTKLLQYSGMPAQIEEEIEYFRQRGAAFFAPLQGTVWAEQERVLRYLDSRYFRIELGDFDLYDLRKPLP